MAWVSRSIRETSIITNPTTTGENLGPGSYLTHGPIGRTPRYASAPFLSTEKRKTITSVEKFQTPGPGSYYHQPLESPSESNKKDTSSVFRSTTSRFNQSSLIQSQELPGPGSYFNQDQEQYLKRKTFSPKNKRTSSPPRNLSTAPSIPANSQSHGYEEGPNGELIRQSPPVRRHMGTQQDSIGPGAYFVDENSNSKVLKNHGIFSSNTKRQLFKVQDTPGPGTYSADITTSSHSDLRNYVSVFHSKTKRSSLIPPDKLKFENIGPGSYEPKEPKYMKEKKKQFPFGSTTPRSLESTPTTSNNPGPGEYFKKDVHHDLPINTDISKVHGAFNSKSERFTHKPENTELGPGSYISHDSNSLITELSKKTKGSYGVFGSTAARFTYRELKPTAPPPGSYNPTDTSQYDIRKPDQRSFVFQSRTKRTTQTEKKRDKEVFPAVGQYNITENWSKKSFNVSDPKMHGFISSSKRFSDTKILDRATLLGPNYLPPGMSSKKPRGINIAKSLGHSTLVEQGHNHHLGPGSYDLTQTWLKPSYNVTINLS
ncbi:hypothetical protein FDP41_010865 [Naegleria fowleri]|uniref:Sperm-tail PG-rich repeat-containing protein 2 n=1 Tax=Naegleria fowleri TaxID=5763 RepID=A0A6A5C556_NAEFO|nr:uncharacterized protein FDP41_010865 [Naegleria fowleri]KAF0982886.1 hypothetical protein FDP41_010865 [Naegleria fowleri]